MKEAAHFLTVTGCCPHGCPVLVLSDQNGQPFAEAHIPREHIESLIADLRRAAADGEALERPLA